MERQGKGIFRREFLKGLGAIPFLGYFAFNFRGKHNTGIISLSIKTI